MKLKIAMISLLALLLLIGACDRYDHDFTKLLTGDVDIDLETFMSIVDQSFAGLNEESFAQVQYLYAEDYIHNGVSKGERLAWIESFLDEPGVSFTVSESETHYVDESHGIVNWRLTISTMDTKAILADSLFVGEKARFEEGIWLLEGNKVCIQDPKQLVIAEYFTFDSCPNCPPAEAKLQELQDLHPNFIYLEHHITNALQVQGNDTPAYYSAYSAPTAVFQGSAKVVGSADADLQNYESIVGDLVNEDISIGYTLENVTYDEEGISAKVMMDMPIAMDISDMYLNYVIITDEVSQTNVNGDPLHNVVRAVGRQAISEQDLEDGAQISLVTAGFMPSSYKLVVYAQYRPQTFTNESRIFGGTVYQVSAM